MTRTYGSVYEIVLANAQNGGYFFSDGAKRFFKSRYGETVYGGRYFITSERNDLAPRRYTIRVADDDGGVDDVGAFQQYGSHIEARRAIEKMLREQGEAV